ncbi:hypothetical protein O181_074999 [Austropuccinia psidii MF-1]|uniref:Uncharacterized protein n=1 Tax=Austropuccinia psidii MF-1 TaxID=1389203 RepID=A0A9Q3IE08_9BASI|nr:hypothetical protein [Austropuccinia psidii MF-1]
MALCFSIFSPSRQAYTCDQSFAIPQNALPSQRNDRICQTLRPRATYTCNVRSCQPSAPSLPATCKSVNPPSPPVGFKLSEVSLRSYEVSLNQQNIKAVVDATYISGDVQRSLRINYDCPNRGFTKISCTNCKRRN